MELTLAIQILLFELGIIDLSRIPRNLRMSPIPFKGVD
jgi:hypothetical protein